MAKKKDLGPEIKHTEIGGARIEDDRFVCTVSVELCDGRLHYIDVESTKPVSEWEE